jgi:hypothetical protein
MKRISSRYTAFQKKGIFAFMLICLLLSGAEGLIENQWPIRLTGMLVMAGLFCIITAKANVGLVDEVFDNENSLIIRLGARRETIFISEISTVNVSTFHRPPKVTVTLIRRKEFGNKFAFLPQINFPFSGGSPIVNDLSQRVCETRKSTV